MKWNESLSVNNPTVDNQHKKIFEAIDDFINACNQRKGNEEVLNVLEFLKKYTIEHFRDEEKLMASNKYIDLENHKKAHKVFLSLVDEVDKECREKGVTLSTIMNVNLKINGGLRNHILKLDKAYAEWVKNK